MTAPSHIGSAARRAKDVARALLGRAGPFRGRERDAMAVAAYGQDLVERIPDFFAELQKNRSAACVRACVARSTGTREFVRTTGYAEMLSGLADAYDPRHLERMRNEVTESVDSFDLRRLGPSVVCIENDYRAIWRAMTRPGYRPYARIRQDEIYLARGFRPVALQ